AILQQADSRGLNSEDYDASRWQQRLGHLDGAEAAARFDVGLTVSVMRYLSDLEAGKVNPRQLKFAIAQKNSRYDLAQFVRQELANGQDLPATLAAVEPQYERYRQTIRVLQHYMELAHQESAVALSVPAKPISPGGHYAAVAALARRLELLGDLPAGTTVPTGD